MEYSLFFTISIPGMFYSICWLIDRKDQRRFCKNAASAEIKFYIQILKSSKKTDLPRLAKPRKNKNLIDNEVMKAA